jgi:hypothetical protein
MSLRLTTRFGHPTFADMPWETPLSEWNDLRIVTPVKGLHRHVVNFVAFGDALYAMKELPGEIAANEYRMLRELAERNVPVVEAVGTVTGRVGIDGEPLDAVLITRHLDYALPYRSLFHSGLHQELWSPLLDSLALLLVRIHLAGFFWGDCSLSNALFRRDAGALAATLVDAETGELHDTLSAGQRAHDLMLAEMNVGGELLDLAMGGGWEDSIDAGEIAADLVRRYEQLWIELTRDQEIHGNKAHVIESRVRRLNELGFDVSEIIIEGDDTEAVLRMRTDVIEAGHHQRELMSLTGLDVQENQARRLLNDIRSYRATLRMADGVNLSEHMAAIRWFGDVFHPTIEEIPVADRHKREPAELFHQILEHRWYLSEVAGQDVGLAAARDSYVLTVLAAMPDETHAVLDAVDADPQP